MVQIKKRRTNMQILWLEEVKDLQVSLIDYLICLENINLTVGNKFEKLKLLFVSELWGSLNALCKVVLEAYKKREQNLTQ